MGISTALATQIDSTTSLGWLPQTVIVFAILVASSIFLWPSMLEFPMDDSYIHFVYAENLSESGKLFFNVPEEAGVGTSSLLWVLILAFSNWVGLSMHWAAKFVGLAALAVVGVGIYHLLRPLVSPWVASIIVLLVVLSGHMLWFALSGMETTLFLALGILALLCYREEKWALLGIFLGLLVITRIEGALLAVVIGLFDVWRYRCFRRNLLVVVVASGLICFPWILYLWLRTGSIIPTSGTGRHFSTFQAIQVATSNSETLALFRRFPGFMYPFLWIGYTIEFVLGGYALPAPYLYFNSGFGSIHYRLSVWSILGTITVVLPLLWISFRKLVGFFKLQGWERDGGRLPFLIFLSWVLVHNISYMVYMPVIGTASRYASLNHIALWLALGLGIWYTRESKSRFWFAVGIATLAFVNTVYWNKVYDANLEHMVEVRIAAAEYILEQIPEDEICAARDVGALGFYGRRPLVDMGGLVEPGIIQWYQAGKLDQYLIDYGVTCVAVPGLYATNKGGIIDINKELGLSQSSLFGLRQEKVFGIHPERWLLGYLPTLNYQATVIIYKLTE